MHGRIMRNAFPQPLAMAVLTQTLGELEISRPMLQEGAKALLGQKYAEFKASQLTRQAAASTPKSGIPGAVVSTKAG